MLTIDLHGRAWLDSLSDDLYQQRWSLAKADPDSSEGEAAAFAAWCSWPFWLGCYENRLRIEIDDFPNDFSDYAQHTTEIRSIVAYIHERATDILTALVVAKGLDAVDLIEEGRFARELITTKGVSWISTEEGIDNTTWPAALGSYRYELPPATQESISKGEAVLKIVILPEFTEPMTVKQIAEELGVGERTVYRRFKAGEIRRIKVGQLFKVDKRTFL